MSKLCCLGNHRLQNKSYVPAVTLNFHDADAMGSKAENILQSMQTHCSTCSVAPPIKMASQLHFGCALKRQSPGCGTEHTYNTHYPLRSVSTVLCSTKCIMFRDFEQTDASCLGNRLNKQKSESCSGILEVDDGFSLICWFQIRLLLLFLS